MNLFDLMAVIRLDKSEYEQGLREAEGLASGFGGALKNAAKIGGIALTAATTATVAFGKSSVDAGMQFDSSMAQVAATMGTTVDQIQNLRDFAQEMGSTTAFSATEAADALNYMALAGYDAETSINMLPNVLNLAAAGNIELARASDMVTDAQTALGLSLEETEWLVDEMAKTSSKSNTSVEQLGDAILTVGGNAKNLAGGTVELNQVLGLLADNGIKGSEAGTHLRNIMLAMTPTTDAAAAAFERLGVDAYDAQGELRPMSAIFRDLSGAMSNMTSQERTDTINAIFNKTDLAAVNALLDTSVDRWSELAVEIVQSEGAAQAMANTQLDNLAGDITLFKSALEGAQIAISDGIAPALREFVQFGADGLSKLTEGFKEGGVSGAIDAFGEIVSEGLGMLVESLPSMVEAGAQVLGAVVSGIIDNLPTMIKAATELISTLASDISEALPDLIPAAVETVASIVKDLIDNVPALVESAIAIIISLAEGIVNAIPTLLEYMPQVIESIVSSLSQMAPRLITAAARIILELAKGLIKSIPTLIKSIPQIIKAIVSGLLDGIKEIRDVGSQLLTGLWDGINDKVSWLKGKVAGVVDKIKGWFTGKSGFDEHSPSKWAADVFEKLLEGGAEGLENGERGLLSTVGGVVGAVKDSFQPSASMGLAVAGGYSGAAGTSPTQLSITLVDNIDGAVFARKTFQYMLNEAHRQGYGD